jgi:hypothetical protein
MALLDGKENPKNNERAGICPFLTGEEKLWEKL